MRRLLALPALIAVVAVSAGLISAAADPAGPKLLVLSASQLRTLKSPVTRDQQLAMIRRGPTAMKEVLAGLSGASAGGGVVPIAQLTPWQNGIVLTPFAPSYGDFGKTSSALCGTDHATLWPQCPLPTTATPILWIGGASGVHSLDCTFMPPVGGVYAVTFSVASGQTTPPRVVCNVNHGTTTDIAVVGDQPQPQKSTQWTGLVTVPDQGTAALATIAPAENALHGWCSVTIRKL